MIMHDQIIQINTESPDYLRRLKIIKHLQVIKDTAEGAIKYINILAKHEDQKQQVVQVVSECEKLQMLSMNA